MLPLLCSLLCSPEVVGLPPLAVRLFVVATPGWITGQSYMIAAALLCRVPSVLLEGSPISPPDRFAAVITRHRATVLKAGSTFLRTVRHVLRIGQDVRSTLRRLQHRRRRSSTHSVTLV